MKNLPNSGESILGVCFSGGCEFNTLSYQSTKIVFSTQTLPSPLSVTLGKFEYVNPRRVSLSMAHLDGRAVAH